MNECLLYRLRESRQKKTREALRQSEEKGDEEEHEEEEEKEEGEEEEETRALDYTEKERTKRDCSNGSRDEKTCTRRGGPFSALNVAICGPPSSLRLSDLTWSFFRSGFSPRTGALTRLFCSACARKWLRRPNMAALLSLFGEKGVEIPTVLLGLTPRGEKKKASPSYRKRSSFSRFFKRRPPFVRF